MCLEPQLLSSIADTSSARITRCNSVHALYKHTMNQITVVFNINHKPTLLTDRSTIDLASQILHIEALDQLTLLPPPPRTTSTTSEPTSHLSTTAPATQQIYHKKNPMDSALIHLLPNLFPSSFRRRHHPDLSDTTTSPTPQQSPPPPYALHPPTVPTSTINIPLTISLLADPKGDDHKRALLYCLQDHYSLSPQTTYKNFIDGLRTKLTRLRVSGGASEKGISWRVGISATGRSKSRVFGRRVLWGGSEVEVERESWEDVKKGFVEGRFVGWKVVCWRE